MIQTELAILVVLLLVALSQHRLRLAAMSTLVFVAISAEIRRYLQEQYGAPSTDPLLLVGPCVAVALTAVIARLGLLNFRSKIGRPVLFLTLVMAVEILNPLQGGILVGLAGGIFYIVPLLWFWIGQSMGSPNNVHLLVNRVLVPVAVAAALLGLYQSAFGLLSFEKAWLDQLGYGYMLNVGSAIRAFSFFPSSSEYAHFLAITIVAIIVSLQVGVGRHLVFALPLLASALFLTGSRGIVVLVLIAVSVCWAMLSRRSSLWAVRILIATAFAAACLVYGLTKVQDVDLPAEIQPLVARQAQGLLHPLQSTGTFHFDMIFDGLRSGLDNPEGLGLGATTRATAKFGGSGTSSEFDISNMFIALGLVGGTLYSVVVYKVFRTALIQWRERRTPSTLIIFGALTLEIGSWLFSGHYLVTAVIWFLIGALDRQAEYRLIEPRLARHRLVAKDSELLTNGAIALGYAPPDKKLAGVGM